MINHETYLHEKIKPIISEWNENGIYAISFFVNSNEAYTYQAYKNLSEFAISYNTESDCNHAPMLSEERWNYAFWRQNTTHIIDPNEENNEGLKTLLKWYEENAIKSVGVEDTSNIYDENMLYIGKGPIGYYEILIAVSNVARHMQASGFISNKFGKVPIIVHDLEYPWYVKEATAQANLGGEANTFLEYMGKH